MDPGRDHCLHILPVLPMDEGGQADRPRGQSWEPLEVKGQILAQARAVQRFELPAQVASQ